MIDRKELKIGDYCRTKDGYIAKLIDYGFNSNVIGKCLTFDSIIRNEKYKKILFDSEIDKYITKIGKTIGDVAEVGDIAYMFAGLPIFKKLTQDDIIEIKLHNYIVLNIMSEQLFNSISYKVNYSEEIVRDE